MLAQTINNPAIGNLANLSGSEFLGNVVSAAISLGFIIGTLVFFFMLLSGAIQWISSGGDKTSYESAKQRITQAFVGLVILFSFFAILNLTECFFGIGLRQIRIGTLNISFASAPFCP